MIEAIALHAEHTQEIQQLEELYYPQQSEITVIINDKGGISRFQDQKLWSARQEFIAYVDENGNFFDKKGSLNWLVENNKLENIKIHFGDREGVYTVKVRQHYPANPKDYTDFTKNGWQIPDLSSTFMLVDVINKTDNDRLKQALIDYKKPVIIEDEQLGEIIFNRDLGEFTGTVYFIDKQIKFVLNDDVDSDDNQPKANSATRYLKNFLNNSKNWNKKLHQFATDTLIQDAKNWQLEQGNLITNNEFYQRIQLSEVNFYNDGSFEVIFEDDGIFSGHIIIISGHINGELEDASIAG